MQQDDEPSLAARQQQQEQQLADSSLPIVECNTADGSPNRSLSVLVDHKGLLLPVGPEGWAVIDGANQLRQWQCWSSGSPERDLKTSLDKVGKTDMLRPVTAHHILL